MWRRAAWVGVVGSLFVGCLGAPSGDDGDEPTQIVSQPVRCPPRIDRYPVAGAHNGGYDRSWSTFTCHPHPGHAPDNSDYGGDHHGNDLFAPRGTPVVAPRDGVVTRSGVASSTSGNRVTIEDECGWSYYLGHLHTIAVGVGTRVRAGQVIGTLGNTGATNTAPHIHFNVHRDGNYNNDTDPFPLLQAADATACGMRCTPRCEGSVVVDAHCGRGDCGVFGSRCVNDTLGVRCAFFACPSQGQVDVCLDASRIARCNNGQVSPPGDCSAYGARCVRDSLGARCVFVFCPERGEADVCWQQSRIGHCRNGALTEQGDCAVYGAFCSTAVGGQARCMSVFCVAGPTETPRAHDVCLPDGRLGSCSNVGGIGNVRACPAGTRCTNDPAGNGRCVAPTPPDAGVVRPDAGGAVDAGGAADAGGAVDAGDPTDGGQGDEDVPPGMQVPEDVVSIPEDVPLVRVDAVAVLPEVPGAVLEGDCGCRVGARGAGGTRGGGAVGVLAALGLLGARRRRRGRGVLPCVQPGSPLRARSLREPTRGPRGAR